MLKPFEIATVNFMDLAKATADARSLQQLGFGWKTLIYLNTSQIADYTFPLSEEDLACLSEIPASL